MDLVIVDSVTILCCFCRRHKAILPFRYIFTEISFWIMHSKRWTVNSEHKYFSEWQNVL